MHLYYALPCSFLLLLTLSTLGFDGTEEQPIYTGLGKHSRPVTQHSRAQVYFDQGLSFLYAFNHDEARRAFQQSVRLAPECAMAHWGIAISYGSHYNLPVVKPENEAAALRALDLAIKHQAGARPEDQILITSLISRFAEKAPEDRAPLNAAYSKAMKAAWEKYPKDADIGALYAESLMNLRPWDLWTADRKPYPETVQVLDTLEGVLKVDQNHPLALHLKIHALEASPNPAQCIESADRLRHLQPGLGHMVHMPSHIDIRTGRWQQAIEANERAIGADAAYRQLSPKQGFYRLYMAHNHHMLMFAAMMSGQSAKAMKAIRAMAAGIPSEWVAVKENAAIADGFLAAPLEVMMRFGQWDAILKEPELPEMFPISRALRHHARAVALGAQGKVKEARETQKLFRSAVAATAKDAIFGNNTAETIFSVADLMLEGELLYREEKLDEAIEKLRKAVEKEAQLRYDEPPDWIIPTRHPLGAILMKAGRFAEAEKVYREDLKQWPQNGWSLYGLAKCLKAQKRDNDTTEIENQFAAVWSKADVSIDSSCKCVEMEK